MCRFNKGKIQKVIPNIRTASRTDIGVHALRNAFTFNTVECNSQQQLIKVDHLKKGINSFMVDNDYMLRVQEIKLLKDINFDCRRWAKQRTYVYRILIAKDPERLMVHDNTRALILDKLDLEKFEMSLLMF